MVLNENTTRAELSAACRSFELVGPELCDGPDQAEIAAVLANRQACDRHGNDFGDMWRSDAMDEFLEAVFADYEACGELMEMIAAYRDERPEKCKVLAAKLDELAGALAEEL